MTGGEGSGGRDGVRVLEFAPCLQWEPGERSSSPQNLLFLTCKRSRWLQQNRPGRSTGLLHTLSESITQRCSANRKMLYKYKEVLLRGCSSCDGYGGSRPKAELVYRLRELSFLGRRGLCERGPGRGDSLLSAAGWLVLTVAEYPPVQ